MFKNSRTMPKIPKGVTLQIQKQVSSIENLKNRSSEPVFKRKQAGTGPNRRHIQGSTSCEVWGKMLYEKRKRHIRTLKRYIGAKKLNK